MPDKLHHKLINSIENDSFMINVLKTVRELNLNDCWVGAGFVRNKIWDEKHGKDRSELNDVDVIYFNNLNPTKEQDIQIEMQLQKTDPKINWSVKNQSRMHLKNGHEQYINCNDAISFWPETATAIAVRLNANHQIEYLAPYGLADLFNLIVQPTPKVDLAIYNRRINKKNWGEKWRKLTIK